MGKFAQRISAILQSYMSTNSSVGRAAWLLNQRVGFESLLVHQKPSLRGGFLKAAPKRLICSEDSRKDTSCLFKNTVSCSSRCFWVLLLFLTAAFWNHQNFSGNNYSPKFHSEHRAKRTRSHLLRLQFEKAACPEYHFKERLSICSSTEVPALYEGKEKWFDSLILSVVIAEESFTRKKGYPPGLPFLLSTIKHAINLFPRVFYHPRLPRNFRDRRSSF